MMRRVAFHSVIPAEVVPPTGGVDHLLTKIQFVMATNIWDDAQGF
jgi:hypothetical protein